MPIASIGVLKSGAAYQPLDPSYPPERLQFMIKDANATLLIADENLLELCPITAVIFFLQRIFRIFRNQTQFLQNLTR